MSASPDQAYQIVARGPRAEAEAAAVAIDTNALLEGATYSILEEDEDKVIITVSEGRLPSRREGGELLLCMGLVWLDLAEHGSGGVMRAGCPGNGRKDSFIRFFISLRLDV